MKSIHITFSVSNAEITAVMQAFVNNITCKQHQWNGSVHTQYML